MKRGDPRALEHRVTIGAMMVLAWRSWVACRWPIVLVGVPSMIADAGAYWLAFNLLEGGMPEGWREISLIWLSVPVRCIAFVSITYAAVSHAQRQTRGARDVLRFPWRRVPAALAAGFIVQTASYWPLPLLDWTDAIGAGLFIDYAILTINVLTFDVLFFVLLPVVLTEKQPLVGTFRRSIRLAMYHPWRILAVDAGLWIAYFVLDEPISQAYYMIDPQWATLAWNGMTTLLFVLIISLSCCLAAATYHLIRSEHEGPAPEVMARVFD